MKNPLTQCDGCSAHWGEDKLDPVTSMWARTEPGGIIPSGQCPDKDCGALCYPVLTMKQAAAQVLAAAASDLLGAVRAARHGWGKLHDIVSDLVESGKLSESNLPDDYQALVLALKEGNRAEQVCLKAINKAGGANV